MTNRNDNSANRVYKVFYNITKNIFYAYLIITLLAVLTFVGYGYVMHAFFNDSALWQYLGSLIS